MTPYSRGPPAPDAAANPADIAFIPAGHFASTFFCFCLSLTDLLSTRA